MKSVYSKLILAFLSTILISFTIAAFIGIKSNYQQIEDQGETELASANEYVSKLVNVNDNYDYLINKYAKNSSYVVYIFKDGSLTKYNSIQDEPSYSQINKEYIKKTNGFIYANHNLQGYADKYKIDGKEYSIFVYKDYTNQKGIFTYSSVLILGCIFLVGSIIFLIVADYIIKPITRLNKATKELSNGNYDVRVTCTGDDEISNLTENFNKMAQQLSKNDETRQKFISDVSHEFQTPLTSIQGFANILKDEELTKEQKDKYLNIIIYNSKRLSGLAKNMLQLTLLETGDGALEITEYSLVNQLERIITSLESQASSKAIEIQFNHSKDILINADEGKLEQVWTNLISNAIKYTNRKGLVIVGAKQNNKAIIVTVEDTGMGMSQNAISHIYERFYREEKARSEAGNGLGLSIVKTILDQHDATIDVSSEIDVGTKFTITFPDKRSIKDIIKKG
ncbi:MAG: HAMP domain-containing sensor histidine kinase [Thomasclavelia sp.]|nr:HAMP domain-containing sensor histidine kinase [Thomasclavelia sp.]